MKKKEECEHKVVKYCTSPIGERKDSDEIWVYKCIYCGKTSGHKFGTWLIVDDFLKEANPR